MESKRGLLSAPALLAVAAAISAEQMSWRDGIQIGRGRRTLHTVYREMNGRRDKAFMSPGKRETERRRRQKHACFYARTNWQPRPRPAVDAAEA